MMNTSSSSYSTPAEVVMTAIPNPTDFVIEPEKLRVYQCQVALLLTQLLLVLLLRMFPGRGFLVSLLCCLLIGTEICLNPMNTEISDDLELRIGHINYGAARGTGSIAFAPVSILLGKLLEEHGTRILLLFSLICIALQGLTLFLLCFSIKRTLLNSSDMRSRSRSQGGFYRFFQENRRFFGLLAGVALLFFSHNLVNNYLINVVRNAGGDTSDMGTLSGFTAVMEIPMMFFYDRLCRRFRCSSTVRVASSMFTLKMLAIAMAVSLLGLFAANILQLVSFALFTPAMVRYVNLYIDQKDSAKGQALAFSMVTLGNILSSAVGGVLYDAFPVRTVLLFGVGVSLIGTILCHLFTENA